MDTSRVSFGEMVAAAGGAALLVLMFLPWFGGRLSGLGAPVRVPTQTGWESFGTLFEFLIIAVAAIAIGIAAAHATGRMPALPLEQGLLVMGGGAVAFAIVAIRLLDPPGVIDVALPTLEVDTSRKIAAFLALAAAAVITYGGWLQRLQSSNRRAR
jgi:hypothetical protein